MPRACHMRARRRKSSDGGDLPARTPATHPARADHAVSRSYARHPRYSWRDDRRFDAWRNGGRANARSGCVRVEHRHHCTRPGGAVRRTIVEFPARRTRSRCLLHRGSLASPPPRRYLRRSEIDQTRKTAIAGVLFSMLSLAIIGSFGGDPFAKEVCRYGLALSVLCASRNIGAHLASQHR